MSEQVVVSSNHEVPVALRNLKRRKKAVCQVPAEVLMASLVKLDLSAVKFKLTDPSGGQAWSKEYADQVEKDYKRFLFLTVTNGESIVPTKAIDVFWHQHILDTRKYAKDCQKIFGFFLHHFPYFGMRGVEDRTVFNEAVQRTEQLYSAAFGEPYRKAADVGDCADCQDCCNT